ncbi:TetR/AcrR family transcriptional regulator [Jannaschia sp. R86511]|uniref:TetR/AcrR family transcriptional regulator n=1 Tax=Jannaschia sp. R86511 TaxID=3093853 RepID=UPI0036D2C8E0
MVSAPKGPAGRPRGFDTEEALEQAVRVFWSQGYEGASLEELTRAMGITRTSMYRAFGNKEALFRTALQRYTRTTASYVVQAVERPTAREVAVAFLHGAACATTQPGHPVGCLGVQGALATGTSARWSQDVLAEWREQGTAHLQARFERAVDDGDLPGGVDCRLLACYLMTVSNGIAVQAAGGTPRTELMAVADVALHPWPPVPGGG